MWELVILYGITTSGVGGSIISNMPNKKVCMQTLDTIAVSDNGLNYVSKEGVVIAFCKPAS